MKTHRVTLVNRAVSFDAAPGQTLLEAARVAGLDLPSGCHHGVCLLCAARLKGGRVQQPDGTALTADQLAAHLLLPCVATTDDDCWLEVGTPDAPLLPATSRPRWTE